MNKFLFLSIFVFKLFGQFQEIKSIEEVLKFVEKGTLVIFDIDNTLAAPATVLGSDQWFSGMVKEKIDEGFDLTHAINSSLPIYFLVQFNVDLELVESNSVKVLDEITEKGANSMCLTARSLYLGERTLIQLSKINLKMFPLTEAEKVLTLTHTSLFKSGVLFSGLNDKGETLIAYLDAIGVRPEKIIFVDDKYSNLKSVELAIFNRQIPFVGLHYTYLQEKVDNYNPAEADSQLEAFLRLHSRK